MALDLANFFATANLITEIQLDQTIAQQRV